MVHCKILRRFRICGVWYNAEFVEFGTLLEFAEFGTLSQFDIFGTMLDLEVWFFVSLTIVLGNI